APIRLNFDEELEEDVDVENGFEFFARLRANRLDGCASFADQDCFLAFTLHIDRGADSKKFWSFLETVDHHRNCVGHFVACGENSLLATYLRGEASLRLARYPVAREIGRMLGQAL